MVDQSALVDDFCLRLLQALEETFARLGRGLGFNELSKSRAKKVRAIQESVGFNGIHRKTLSIHIQHLRHASLIDLKKVGKGKSGKVLHELNRAGRLLLIRYPVNRPTYYEEPLYRDLSLPPGTFCAPWDFEGATKVIGTYPVRRLTIEVVDMPIVEGDEDLELRALQYQRALGKLEHEEKKFDRRIGVNSQDHFIR